MRRSHERLSDKLKKFHFFCYNIISCIWQDGFKQSFMKDFYACVKSNPSCKREQETIIGHESIKPTVNIR